MMDNAYNNDAMMDAIQASYPSIGRNARLYCSSHIKNLVVRAILYGEGLSAFSNAIVVCSDDDSSCFGGSLG